MQTVLRSHCHDRFLNKKEFTNSNYIWKGRRRQKITEVWKLISKSTIALSQLAKEIMKAF